MSTLKVTALTQQPSLPVRPVVELEAASLSQKSSSQWNRKKFKEFQDDLEDILSRAGYAGNFRCRGTGVFRRGTHHTKGVTCGGPMAKGLEVYAQYGDNGSRESWILLAPQLEDPFAFHQKVRDALRRGPEPEEELDADQKLVPEDPAVEIDGAATFGQPPESRHVSGFINDEENRGVVLGFIAERIDWSGRISRKDVTEILYLASGVASLRGTGPMHRALVSRGFLIYDGDEFYRVSKEILDQRPAQTKIQVEEPSCPTPGGTTAEPSLYLGRILELERLAAEFESSELEVESARAKANAMREELSRIDEHIRQLCMQQESSRDAALKLAELKKILGL